MSEKNGNGGKAIKITGSIIGVIIAIISLIWTTVYNPLSCAIKTECDKREAEDKSIYNKVDTKLDTIIKTQSAQGERLATIEGKLK